MGGQDLASSCHLEVSYFRYLQQLKDISIFAAVMTTKFPDATYPGTEEWLPHAPLTELLNSGAIRISENAMLPVL